MTGITISSGGGVVSGGVGGGAGVGDKGRRAEEAREGGGVDRGGCGGRGCELPCCKGRLNRLQRNEGTIPRSIEGGTQSL